MKKVHVSDLRTNLSRHLRAVRRGATLEILHRNVVIARIEPIDKSATVTANGLVIHHPTRPGRLSDVPLPPRPKNLKTDAVELLIELRGTR